MEISLQNGLYAINPRRIVYIEYYKENHRSVYGYGYGYGRVHPNDKNEETQDYQKVIVIHMTDNETIRFETEDSSDYEEIKNKLRDIVGG
ncbi:hypothetical protein [Treponema endosymbiont of Eucomonympha sp.]|uniref:hypothetical protein n=1 Tax=Treponema endosymbiont of Eucomonympha sp. TaxID=1580831 RepID=UPI001396B32F|nr:hypothetical protein [Treponema endosymbiont of Eucomonympha sp.]